MNQPQPNPALQELSIAAEGAMTAALEYLQEAVMGGRKTSTPADADRLATAMMLTIAYLEAYFKQALPEAVRTNVRAAIELFADLSTKGVNAGLTTKEPGAIIDPNVDQKD